MQSGAVMRQGREKERREREREKNEAKDARKAKEARNSNASKVKGMGWRKEGAISERERERETLLRGRI